MFVWQVIVMRFADVFGQFVKAADRWRFRRRAEQAVVSEATGKVGQDVILAPVEILPSGFGD